MTQEPILEIKGISTKYGRKKILDGFTLDVQREEIFSLLGPSGCGKTTLLKCVAGLEKVASGEIKILGETVQTPRKSLSIQKRGLGMVFQDNALFPHLTVYENVIFGIPNGEAKIPETRERIRDLLITLHLLPLSKKYPHEISGGQKQRTSLARSIAPRPKLVLLDEPFNSQDVELKEQIMDSVVELLRKNKITALLVTHDQDEAFKVSHRVGVMKEFHLEQLGSPEEIYHSAATRFTAGFIGSGAFLRAIYSKNRATNDWFCFQGKKTANNPFQEGQEVWVHLRPEDVILCEEKKGVPGTVVHREFRNGNYFYRVALNDSPSHDPDSVIYSLMPIDFVKAVGDRVQAEVVEKPYPFFPLTSDS